MSVGLWDADKIKYLTAPLNLELMKYSTYYKNKREIVTLSPDLSPNKYTKFIFRKDYSDGEFLPILTDYDNIIYGGLAFSNDIYVPLDESIEKLQADVYIYERMRRLIGPEKYLIAAFDTMLRAQHVRLSLDGKTIWNKFEKQLNINPKTATLFLHDKDLQNIEGSIETIQYIMDKFPKGSFSRKLAMKFPVIVDNIKDLKDWLQFQSSLCYYSVQYRGVMEDEEIYELLTSKEYQTNPKKIDYIVTASASDENDFVEHYIIRIYFQALFFRMMKIKISLKYEEGFFVDKRWEKVLDLFNSYINTTVLLPEKHFNKVIKYDSLYSFVYSFEEKPKFRQPFSKDDARKLFSFVREKNYELFKQFYDCNTVRLIGGNFQPWKET